MAGLRRFLIPTALLLALVGACAHRPVEPSAGTVCGPDEHAPPCLAENLMAAGVERAELRCNSDNAYGRALRSDAKLAAADLLELVEPHLETLDAAEAEALRDEMVDAVMWWLVRGILLEGDNNNLGAVVVEGHSWTDESGRSHPLTVFRTGFTPDPRGQESCYRSLLESGRVRHVLNLYDGEMHVDDLVEAERAAAEEIGATYVLARDQGYGLWRDTLRSHPEPGPERAEALQAIGRLIREQILEPGGGSPRGNVLIHCGGGMHRTGMIVGVLERHVNGTPMEEVERAYRFHVDYEDADNPGGTEEDNLAVIRDFDPAFLE
jgi:hypothetical protein